MSQDDFTAVSSRTFVSSMERGLKSPTVQKLSELAGAMGMDPAAVLVASLLEHNAYSTDRGHPFHAMAGSVPS